MTFTKVSEMWTSLSVFMQAISASHPQEIRHISTSVQMYSMNGPKYQSRSRIFASTLMERGNQRYKMVGFRNRIRIQPAFGAGPMDVH